jgi:hypothetical protein
VGNKRDENEFMRGRQIASGLGVLYLTSEKHVIHHFLFWLTRYKICFFRDQVSYPYFIKRKGRRKGPIMVTKDSQVIKGLLAESERYKNNNNTNSKKTQRGRGEPPPQLPILLCPYQEKYIHTKVANKGWVKSWWQSIHR